MRFTQLQFHYFRNLRATGLDPAPGFNVLFGDNAQGKTNILEGIYLLGHLKSFRTSRNEDLITSGENEAKIKAAAQSGGVRTDLALKVLSEGKTVLVNAKRVRSAADLPEVVRQVLFSPEEVGLAKGSPAGRRSLMDRAIFQADPAHLYRVQQYNRCLKQRNRLLKEAKKPGEIAPWTAGLIREGARIRAARARFIADIHPLFTENYVTITGAVEKADLFYSAGPGPEAFHRETLAGELNSLGERERRLGTTLAGPHRDDVEFLVEGLPLRHYGSQGQQRSFILAFKTALVRYIEGLTGQTPVLLLDDITSELDGRRKDFLFRFLLARGGQVFLTTTDSTQLPGKSLPEAAFFRVEGGTLRQER